MDKIELNLVKEKFFGPISIDFVIDSFLRRFTHPVIWRLFHFDIRFDLFLTFNDKRLY